MSIGFTGHRDCIANEESLLRIEQRFPGATWIHGGAKDGFDAQVDAMARKLGKVEKETLIIYRPNYRLYPAKVAPVMRNQTIVDASELLIACYDGRKSGGTHDCIGRATRKQMRIEYVTPIKVQP